MSYTKKFEELTRKEKDSLKEYDIDGLMFQASEDIQFYMDNIVEYTGKEFSYVYCSELNSTNSGDLYSIISFNDKFYNELYSNLKEEGKAYELLIQDTDYDEFTEESFDDFFEKMLITVYCPNGTLETSFDVLKELANTGTSGWINDDYFAELFDYKGNVKRSQEVVKDIVKTLENLFDKCRDEYENKLLPIIRDYEDTIEELDKGYGDAWDKHVETYFEDAVITFDDYGDIEEVDFY